MGKSDLSRRCGRYSRRKGLNGEALQTKRRGQRGASGSVGWTAGALGAVGTMWVLVVGWWSVGTDGARPAVRVGRWGGW